MAKSAYGLDNILTGFLVMTSVWFLTWDDHFVAKKIVDKRVLITCAANSCAGVGEQVAYQYCKLGARVMLATTSPPHDGNLQLRRVADRCRELGAVNAHVTTADLADTRDRSAVVTEVVSRLGGLDHLVMLNYEWPDNDSGLAPTTSDKAAVLSGNASIATLHKDYLENFVTYVDLTHRLLPILAQSGGNLGLVTSLAGKIGVPGRPSYSANRFALHGFFSSLRQELIRNGTGVAVSLGLLALPDNSDGSGLDAAATSIMQGVSVRAREIYAGRMAYLLVNAHAVFPSYVERYLMS